MNVIIQELKELFNANGVNKGDIICIHSDITSFGIPTSLKEHVRKNGINFLMDSYIDTFKAVVSESGLILMPSFTYSACHNELYDIGNTKSTVGALTEYFRNKKDVKRSLHPIFSFTAWGNDVDNFLNLESFNCYGKKSFFGKLHDLNITYVLFGVDIQHGATFVYYSEEKAKVYYRYYKEFSGIIKNKNGQFEKSVRYFVRDLDLKYEDNWYDLENKAIEMGIARIFEYSGGKITLTKSQEIDKLIQKELKKNKNFLIKLLEKI